MTARNGHALRSVIIAEKRPFYVYMLKRPDGSPFYVGAGTGSRMFHHERDAKQYHGRNHRHAIIRKIWAEGGVVGYEIASFFNDRQDAIDLEVKLIAEIGRHDQGRGPLANMTDGGDGGIEKLAWTEKGKEQVRENGRKARHKISASIKALWDNPEYRARQTERLRGRKMGAAFCVKQSAAYRRKWADPEIRAKMNSAQRVAMQTPEYREKKRLQALAQWADPERRPRKQKTSKSETDTWPEQVFPSLTKRR